MDNYLILTEAGEGIGYGHIVRCEEIADEILKTNNNCDIFLDFKGKDFYANAPIIKNINWLNTEILQNNISENKYKTIIIDSYLSNKSTFNLIKKLTGRIVIIDDYNRMKYPNADLIINLGIFGDKIDYSNQNCKVIAGKKYIIIRNDFLSFRDKHKINEDIKNITLIAGGSDIRNLLPQLINIIKKNNFNITVISGNNDYKNKLIQNYNSKQINILGKLSTNEIITEFCNSDIVISAAGQTLNELAFLGIPTIAVCIDKDQEYNMEGYYNYKFIKQKIYWNDKNFDEKIVNAINKIKSVEIRNKLKNIGKELVTKNGSKLIVKEIMKIN